MGRKQKLSHEDPFDGGALSAARSSEPLQAAQSDFAARLGLPLEMRGNEFPLGQLHLQQKTDRWGLREAFP